VGGKKKKKEHSHKTYNGSGYAEKGTKRQLPLRLREFRKSFVKSVGQPHSFESLDPEP